MTNPFYIVCDTLADAETFRDEQNRIILAEITKVAPEAVKFDEIDGVLTPTGLYGRSAATGEIVRDRGVTTSYAEPQELRNGKWAVIDVGTDGDERLGGEQMKRGKRRKTIRRRRLKQELINNRRRRRQDKLNFI